MTDHLNPHRIYPDDTSRRIDNPPGFDSVRPMANQCVACGAEMPEGDQVCKLCRDKAAFEHAASRNIDDRIKALEAELAILRRYKTNLEAKQ